MIILFGTTVAMQASAATAVKAWSKSPQRVKVIKGPAAVLKEPAPMDDVKVKGSQIDPVGSGNAFSELCLGWCRKTDSSDTPSGKIQTNSLNEVAKPGKTSNGVAGIGWNINW